MEALAFIFIFLAAFLLFLIQLRLLRRGLPLWGALMHELMLKKVESTDKKLAAGAGVSFFVGLIFLCLSF